MIARLRPFALGTTVAAVLVTASCGTFSAAVASVDGHDIDADDYEAILVDATAAASITGITLDETTGTVEGDAARAVLQVLIRDAATSSYLADAGQPITDADREEVLASVGEGERAQLDEMSAELTRLVVDNSALNVALQRVQPPTESELQRRYEERPVSTGALCLRHILVGSEDEAREILDELAAGGDFARLAEERSSDEASAANGGALGVDDQECLDLATARQSLDPQFVAGAFDARAGVPTGPVETQFGWHVILARPFDEVGSALGARYEDNAGALGLDGALATADVTIDPRYGSWNAVTGSIVGLG